jgi:imidazolonepropionase-like amidohydrolase
MATRLLRSPLMASVAAMTGLVIALWPGARVHAQAGLAWAITGARIVPVSGAPIDAGTIVWRDGRILAVGASATVPPGARTIDGKGLTVYPGLIDLGSSAGVEVPAPPRAEARTTEDAERAKRALLVRPHLRVADHVVVGSPALAGAASAGVTAILAVPPAGAIRGQSALVSTGLGDDDPQIGGQADERRGRAVLRSPVAVHVSFPERPPGGDAYPNSLMGVIAYVRQAFSNAQHYQQALDHATRVRTASPPPDDPAFAALQAPLGGRVPVAFHAETAREIRRALDMATAFALAPVIVGGIEADQVAADLKAANARVILGVNYPKRAESLAPDADESLRTLRTRANAHKVAAALDQADVPFAFASDGLESPVDFVKNAGRSVDGGLSAARALRALTLDAATLAGVGDRLGSLDPGKLANLVVTEGDLFAEKTTVKHVFVEGVPMHVEPPAGTRGATRRP